MSVWTRIKAFFVWLVTRMILATVRVRKLYLDRLARARELGRPILYAFWHGRQLGLAGLMALGKRLNEGFSVGMAVDGPRGPAFDAKSGIVVLARRSGSPIVPITAAFGRSLELKKSWDRFRIPIPFAKATVAYGEPILVSKKATSQEMRETTDRLTESLRALTAEVDAYGPRS
jgi:lysophospholipid acyltransferase (LPLAT)-like uncharacterized protein